MSALRSFVAAAPNLVVGQPITLAGEAARKHGAGPWLCTGAREENGVVSIRIAAITAVDPEPAIEDEVRVAHIASRDFVTATGTAYVAAPKVISALFQWQFKRAGRPELFDARFDYDKLFTALAAKAFGKYPVLRGLGSEDRADIVQDVLHQILNAKTIKEMDGEKDPIKYFGGMFQMRMLTACLNRSRREQMRKHKPVTDERNDEEWMDSKAPVQTPHDELDYKQMVEGLFGYIKSKNLGSDTAIKVLKLCLQQKKSNEIARELGISPASVSKTFLRLGELVKEYAKKTDNSLLFSLADQMSKQRRTISGAAQVDGPVVQSDALASLYASAHDTTSAVDEAKLFQDLFKKYQKNASALGIRAARAPAGNVTNVRIKSMPDVLTDDYMASLVLSDQVTTAAIDASANEFMAWQEAQADLLEVGNRLVGLSVEASSVRTVK